MYPSSMGLVTHVVRSVSDGYYREIRTLSSVGARGLAVFLDGEHYWRDLDAIPILQDLVSLGAIPPTHFIFVSHVSAEDRQADFLWNERYADFIGRDVLGWAKGALPEVADGGHLIAGLSLSGLESALIASRHSALFARVLCQSGSFWWLEDHPQPISPLRQRFWLSVGTEETATDVFHPPTPLFQRVSQIQGVEAMAARLEGAGAIVRCNQYSGGHAAAPWREELGPAMTWLFSERR